MEKCSNANCENEINLDIENNSLSFCPKCDKIFCSYSCLSLHLKQDHPSSSSKDDSLNNSHPIQQSNEINSHLDDSNNFPPPSVKRRNSTFKSYFLKTGEIINPDIKSHADKSNYYYFKNFRILKNENKELNRIGTGAFGNVYLAKNRTDGKIFAVKHVQKQNVIDSGASLEIIIREINIQLRLNHPNIVRLYSYYEDNENYFLIMEYLDNNTLFHYIRQKKKLSEKEAFEMFIQVVNAIYFLHINGYIHRDLKPENVLLDKNLNVKLCDFGWCVDLNSGMRSTFCGTFEYMAPEIVNDQKYDRSIDIWSLGVLLYEMTHGYSPFRATMFNSEEEYKEIFKNINNLNYQIDESLNLSKECVELIHKLLTKDSQKRIKIKEIFAQPWIKKFENEMKKKVLKNYNNNASSNISNNYKVDNVVSSIINADSENNINNINNINVINCNKDIAGKKKNNNIKNKKINNNISNNDVNISNNINNHVSKNNIIKEDDKDINNNINYSVNMDNNAKNNDNEINNNNHIKKPTSKKKNANKLQTTNENSNNDNSKSDEANIKNKINNSHKKKNNFNHSTHKKSSMKNISENNKESDMFENVLEKVQKKNEINHKNVKRIYNDNNGKFLKKNSFSDVDIKKSGEKKIVLFEEKDEFDFLKDMDINLGKDNYFIYDNLKESNNEMLGTIKMLENADRVNSELRPRKYSSDSKKEESFWEKFFKPFKCG